MTSRRSFIKKLAVGSAALGSAPALNAMGPFIPSLPAKENAVLNDCGDMVSAPLFKDWKTVFDRKESMLTVSNGNMKLTGRLSFAARGGEQWTIGESRDGVPGRFTLIDLKGNVQGYWIVNVSGNRLELMFYHRSAQNYGGTMSFDGTLSFVDDAFACRTGAKADERVLNLVSGQADSGLNDSIFSPLNDSILKLEAASLSIISQGEGRFAFHMSGRIDKAEESSFSFVAEDGYFRKRYIPYYVPLLKKPHHKVPTGWMSWNTYFDKATAEDNLAEARLGKKYLQPFGCDIWSIESWQGNSDQLPVSDFYNMNLEVNEKQFPEGMKALADGIRKLGFIPGIWTAPFGTGSDEFYKSHRNWFLHDRTGKPISCWNGKYTLDPTVQEALDHITKIHRTASREWGFEYFKIDGMSGRSDSYCAHLYERPEIRECFSDPQCSNPFERVVQAVRSGIGEDRYYLACQGHATGAEAAYADASRLGADIVSPNCPVMWQNVCNQARCFANQAFSHNIVMITDPDTLLVGDLPVEEARTSATIVALPGQHTFFGDKLSGLPEGKMKILQQTLPVNEARPAALYPYFSLMPVWNLSMDNGKMPHYNVVALFNWDDEEKTISAKFDETGIPAGEYVTYEFWTGQAGRISSGESISAVVPAHGVRVLAVHPFLDRPQWIGSDRHVTVNALEITDYIWKEDAGILEMDVHPVAGFPLEMHFHVPSGYEFASSHCAGAKLSTQINGSDLKVSLKNMDGKPAHLTIAFHN